MNHSFFTRLLFATFLVLAFHQSCTNLDEELYDQVLEDDFFQNDEQFIAALGSAYTSLYGMAGHEGYLSMQEVSTDEIVIPQRGGDWGDGGQWLDFHQHIFTPERNVIRNTWEFLYTGINACNRLIFQFSQQDNPEAQAFESELKALRAYYYLLLLDTYGNVPIVTDFLDEEPKPNSSRQEVFQFVESELLENVPNLSRRADASTYGRVNYYVGQAMLGQLYLNAEVYSGTARWSDAVAAYDSIINSNNYGLASNYFDNFEIANSSSPELIFAIPYDKVNARGFNLPQMTLHYAQQAQFNLQEQPWNGYCTMAEFYDSYSDDDVRKDGFIIGPQFALDGSRLTDPDYERPNPNDPNAPSDPDGAELTITKEINEHFPNALRQAGVRVGKYEFEIGGTPDMSNDFPLYRFSEVILGKAEALWRMNPNDGDALVLFNSVRARAGVPAVGSLDRDTWLEELGREFFYEGKRRTQLIRFDAYNDGWEFFTPLDPATAEQREIFPIPLSQINANPLLTQNPGY